MSEVPVTPEPMRILVSRPDRLGDVLLSLPVFEVIKQNYPNAHLTVLVSPLVAPLLRELKHIDEVLVFDPDALHRGLRGFFRLAQQMRRRRFRIMVALQSNRKIAWASLFGAIRYRVGPLSKPHSYLIYNRGMRQRRSLVELHETDYNLQLLKKIGIRAHTRAVEPRVVVQTEALNRAEQWLRAQGWEASRSGGSVPAIVAIHPGMGGSALNWPEAHYLALARALAREGKQILITAGVREAAILKRFKEELSDLGQGAWFYGGADAGTVEDLAALFSLCQLVVAPSTGPMHLAAAVGRRVVTFYSPIRVQSALRWGPYLLDDTRASVLHPQNFCGEEFKCRGTLCNHYPCMKSITVVQALEASRTQLEKV